MSSGGPDRLCEDEFAGANDHRERDDQATSLSSGSVETLEKEFRKV
jgi:hypothetical protein